MGYSNSPGPDPGLGIMDDKQLHWAQRQRRPRAGAAPVGAVLGGLTNGSWFKRQKHLSRFVELIEQLLGPDLARRVSIEGFNRNVLHLAVDSAAHRYELQLLRDELLAAMNQQLSGVFIRELRFTLKGSNQ
jgi:predicted nucleic acid-binding Zn ribbon protein